MPGGGGFATPELGGNELLGNQSLEIPREKYRELLKLTEMGDGGAKFQNTLLSLFTSLSS